MAHVKWQGPGWYIQVHQDKTGVPTFLRLLPPEHGDDTTPPETFIPGAIGDPTWYNTKKEAKKER